MPTQRPTPGRSSLVFSEISYKDLRLELSKTLVGRIEYVGLVWPARFSFLLLQIHLCVCLFNGLLKILSSNEILERIRNADRDRLVNALELNVG